MTSPEGPRDRPVQRLLARGTWPEARYVASALRTETVGGALLLGAAVVALIWANTPWQDAYISLRDLVVGLLALFFLVAGIELKREFVAGDLSDRNKAALPIAAAACGVAVPALLFVGTAALAGGEGDVFRGWAIPTATDIAFALAVLAVIATYLPSALRSFLLTLAVVDDLIAITIIGDLLHQRRADPVPAARGPAAGALVVAAAPRLDQPGPAGGAGPGGLGPGARERRPRDRRWGAAGPARPGLQAPGARPDQHSLAERIEHGLRPWSAGLAVRVFAFFAAGVTIGPGGLAATFADPAALGVVVGLVAGKCLGVFGGTYLFARFTRATLDEDLAWSDVLGLSLLAGVGFTVSLLIGELAFGLGSERDDHVRLGILVGSVLAALLAAVVLRLRNRHYRRIEADETRDDDADGVPDVYVKPDPAIGS